MLQILSSRPSRKRLLLPALLMAVVLVAGVWLWLFSGRVTLPNAMVTGSVLVLEAPFDGRVKEVFVAENQEVQTGQPLLRLDDGALLSAVQEARARLEALDAGASRSPVSPAAVRSAEQAILNTMQTARNEESMARQELEHLTTLHVQAQLALRRLESQISRPPTGQERSQAKLTEIESRANMEAARNALETSSHARAAADNALRTFRAELARQLQLSLDPQQRGKQRELQAAWLEQAQQALDAATISAPFPGIVGRVHVAPGVMVRQGQLVGSLTPTHAENLWVTARLDEATAQRILPGMACRLDFAEAVPPFTLDGLVDSLSPAVDDPGLAPANTGDMDIRILLSPSAPMGKPLPSLRVGMKAGAVIFTK